MLLFNNVTATYIATTPRSQGLKNSHSPWSAGRHESTFKLIEIWLKLHHCIRDSFLLKTYFLKYWYITHKYSDIHAVLDNKPSNQLVWNKPRLVIEVIFNEGRFFIIYPLSFIRIKCLELPMGDLEVDHDIIIIIMYKVSRSKF